MFGPKVGADDVALRFENIVVGFLGDLGVRILSVNLLFYQFFHLVRQGDIKRNFVVFDDYFKRHVVVAPAQPNQKSRLSFQAGQRREKGVGHADHFTGASDIVFAGAAGISGAFVFALFWYFDEYNGAVEGFTGLGAGMEKSARCLGDGPQKQQAGQNKQA